MTNITALEFLVAHARTANRAAVRERRLTGDALLIGMYRKKRDLLMTQARWHQGSTVGIQASLNASKPNQNEPGPGKAVFKA